jgi:prolyl-tRNA synthetase
LRASVAGPDGTDRPVHMGSYGIGVSRLVAAIIEASHDEAGVIWPRSVAPFGVALANLKQGDVQTDAACETAYAALVKLGLEPLYDDTDARPGAKFAAMDLIGVPHQLIVGPKGLARGVVELKDRRSGQKAELSLESALAKLSA